MDRIWSEEEGREDSAGCLNLIGSSLQKRRVERRTWRSGDLEMTA